MFGRGDIYTVHENPAAREPSDRVVLVREGFSFWAFIFTILWLLWHRCWRMAALFALLASAIEYVSGRAELSLIAVAVLQLGVQFWLGCVANDARRASLERSSWREVGIVVGESRLLAERRYFDRLHPAV